MSLLSTISIALGLAMDCFAVSLSTGASHNYLRFLYTLKLGAFFGLFQGFMPILGWFAGIAFNSKISEYGNIISFLLLSFIGGKMLYEGIKKRNKPISSSSDLGIRMLLVMSIATSIDALAVGVTFAFGGVDEFVSLLLHSGIIALISFLFTIIGVYIGAFFGKYLENKSEIFGGIVLIIISLKILLF